MEINVVNVWSVLDKPLGWSSSDEKGPSPEFRDEYCILH